MDNLCSTNIIEHDSSLLIVAFLVIGWLCQVASTSDLGVNSDKWKSAISMNHVTAAIPWMITGGKMLDNVLVAYGFDVFQWVYDEVSLYIHVCINLVGDLTGK